MGVPLPCYRQERRHHRLYALAAPDGKISAQHGRGWLIRPKRASSAIGEQDPQATASPGGVDIGRIQDIGGARDWRGYALGSRRLRIDGDIEVQRSIDDPADDLAPVGHARATKITHIIPWASQHVQ